MTLDDTQDPAEGAEQRSRWSQVGAPLLTAVAVTALVIGALVGWLAFGPHAPGDDSADAGFARDMSEHHAQAVDMSLLVLERTDDPVIRTLAYDIATSQSNQIGRMQGWLAAWGLPLARSGDRMTWMSGHDHGSMTGPAGMGETPMPGMATQAEVEELTAAQGEQADVLFLQLMTTHHIAGVEMARAAVDQVDDPEALRLATAMVNGQASEIELMSTLLQERGSATREPQSEIDALIGG